MDVMINCVKRCGQAVLIKIHVFCQDLKGYNLQFLEVVSLYYGERYGEEIIKVINLIWKTNVLQSRSENVVQK